ncbi:hypothetical protein JG687_00004627 [Phytophthora cactorum]|uniref:HTH CENPB-type domain-containing protein n=1 Tax=Phytophthora cactorum TaxID=29920 RepID=A0A8T1UR03_9STRA|nr:hypothetical protein JG687_00004627 [Phytophthora cactorum]
MTDKSMRKRGRGSGPRLNDLQRLEIIHKHQNSSPPLSMRQIARDFGVDEKSIRRIINAAADIEARASSSAVLNMRAHVHRRPAPRFPELEKTLAAWIDARERAKADISPSVVIDKAKLVARSMGISPDQFKASWGWYDKFSKRYGVRTAFVGSAEVKRDDYKIRETKSLPDLHKLMTQQERAWLDRQTFGSWYSSVFVPFVRERTSKRVLLVVDGERPGHQGNFEDDGVRLVFLPPPLSVTQSSVNVTVNPKMWWIKPLEMGVINALKTKYKYLLVQSVMSYQNAPEEVKAALKAAEESDNSGGVHFGHTPTLLDAARLLEQAWNQIPDDLLENCFARANLVPPSKLLTPPAPPTGMTALVEQNQASMRYSDDIAGKMEEMLISSSLEARVWVMSTQNPPGNLRDRIRAFMYLDDESSFELQRQLQGEIHEALNDQASSASTPDMTALTDGSIFRRDYGFYHVPVLKP